MGLNIPELKSVFEGQTVKEVHGNVDDPRFQHPHIFLELSNGMVIGISAKGGEEPYFCKYDIAFFEKLRPKR